LHSTGPATMFSSIAISLLDGNHLMHLTRILPKCIPMHGSTTKIRQHCLHQDLIEMMALKIWVKRKHHVPPMTPPIEPWIFLSLIVIFWTLMRLATQQTLILTYNISAQARHHPIIFTQHLLQIDHTRTHSALDSCCTWLLAIWDKERSGAERADALCRFSLSLKIRQFRCFGSWLILVGICRSKECI